MTPRPSPPSQHRPCGRPSPGPSARRTAPAATPPTACATSGTTARTGRRRWPGSRAVRCRRRTACPRHPAGQPLGGVAPQDCRRSRPTVAACACSTPPTGTSAARCTGATCATRRPPTSTTSSRSCAPSGSTRSSSPVTSTTAPCPPVDAVALLRRGAVPAARRRRAGRRDERQPRLGVAGWASARGWSTPPASTSAPGRRTAATPGPARATSTARWPSTGCPTSSRRRCATLLPPDPGGSTELAARARRRPRPGDGVRARRPARAAGPLGRAGARLGHRRRGQRERARHPGRRRR